MDDTVEEVWFEVIAAARIGGRGHAGERRVVSGRGDQLGEIESFERWRRGISVWTPSCYLDRPQAAGPGKRLAALESG
jgi:hypothetical protein